MSVPVLRTAKRADAPALADLARRCFTATYRSTHDADRIRVHCASVLGDAEVSRWFDGDATRIMLAHVDAELLGFEIGRAHV